MRGLNGLLVWVMVLVFVAAGLMLLFYTAALLLPIILGVFIFSLVAGWIKRAEMNKMTDKVKVFYHNEDIPQNDTTVGGKNKKQPEVIDAEYEIVEEKDRKN